MKTLLENSKYFTLIGVVTLLIASIATALSGAYETYHIIRDAIQHHAFSASFAVSMIKLMDIFLVSIVLFIFSIALYELFIDDLDLPDWLIIHNLYDLKSKLGGVIILVMAVNFLNHFVEWQDPKTLLFSAISLGIVSASLIAFSHFEKKK